MIEYWNGLIDTMLNGEVRLDRKFAFAQIMIIVVVAFGVPFRILMSLADRRRNKTVQASIYEEMAAKAPPNATRSDIQQMVEHERAARRAAIFETPEIPLRRASRPTDGTFFETVHGFAKAKQSNYELLNAYEQDAAGLLDLAHAVLGPAGLKHLDIFYGQAVPFKSWELKQSLEQIGLADVGDTVERAIVLHQSRDQTMKDFVATGMPVEQARAHPYLPSYDELENILRGQGGHDRFLHAADRYFEAAYPWAD